MTRNTWMAIAGTISGLGLALWFWYVTMGAVRCEQAGGIPIYHPFGTGCAQPLVIIKKRE